MCTELILTEKKKGVCTEDIILHNSSLLEGGGGSMAYYQLCCRKLNFFKTCNVERKSWLILALYMYIELLAYNVRYSKLLGIMEHIKGQKHTSSWLWCGVDSSCRQCRGRGKVPHTLQAVSSLHKHMHAQHGDYTVKLFTHKPLKHNIHVCMSGNSVDFSLRHKQYSMPVN